MTLSISDMAASDEPRVGRRRQDPLLLFLDSRGCGRTYTHRVGGEGGKECTKFFTKSYFRAFFFFSIQSRPDEL